MTRGTLTAPEPLRDEVFAALDAARDNPETPIEGAIVGPIRIENGVILAMISNRQPAPTWDVMRENVHRELRGRFLRETLPRAAVMTYLDPK
jgi:hypothetical protein